MSTHIAHAIRNSSSCADPATCWGPARSAQCIRFEQADGTVHLFPFVQFVCAEFRCENAAELLRIEFGSHCVEIEGVNLGEIVVALQVLEGAHLASEISAGNPCRMCGGVLDAGETGGRRAELGLGTRMLESQASRHFPKCV